MGSLTRSLRLVSMCLMLVSGIAGPVFAAEAVPTTPPVAAPGDIVPDPTEWQAVISEQIDAFRNGDAPTAFSFAAAPFQKAFPDAITFMQSIAASGYAPIFTSVSHSFGKFTKLDDQTVMQIVTLIGSKQELFDAVYQLTKEPGGWRVSGVQLMRANGMAV